MTCADKTTTEPKREAELMLRVSTGQIDVREMRAVQRRWQKIEKVRRRWKKFFRRFSRRTDGVAMSNARVVKRLETCEQRDSLSRNYGAMVYGRLTAPSSLPAPQSLKDMLRDRMVATVSCAPSDAVDGVSATINAVLRTY